MKIVIIGSEGYIGSYLYRSLSKDHDLVGLGRNDGLKYTTEFFGSFDVCVYLAGMSTRQMSEDDVYQNVDDIVKVANLMTSRQLLIYASTTAVYEGLESATEDFPINPSILDAYSRSMLLREAEIRKIGNIRTIGLRLATVVGVSPRQRSDRLHIQMLKSSLFTGRIHVYHPLGLRPILSFIDLERSINSILERADSQHGHQIFNLSSFNTTISSVAATIALKTGAKCIFHDSAVPLKGFSCTSAKFEQTFNFIFTSTNETIIDELINSKAKLLESWQNPVRECLPCLVCGCKNLMEMIDLGRQPLANQFGPLDAIQEKYPLAMYRCTQCYHHQLNHHIPPEVLFTNYIYVSGTTETGQQHFSQFCSLVVSDTGLRTGLVLDIASNDGSQLDKFKAIGWQTIGVDPAENLAPIASAKGHEIIVGFWGDAQIADRLATRGIDVIVAQNVFAHVPNPHQFLEMCKHVMTTSTKLYIQTSQAEIFQNGEFDTIYHEHISFFTVKSMLELTSRCGLYLEDVRKVSIHGTSYIFIIRRSSEETPKKVLRMIEAESYIYSDVCPIMYREHAKEKTRIIVQALHRCHADGFKLIGYGASAKGNTLLNFIYPDIPRLEYIIDENPMKQNLYTPGTKIQVVGSDVLTRETDPIAVLVLAWNFLDEIKKKILTSNPGKKIVLCVPFPSPTVWVLCQSGWDKMSDFPIRRQIDIPKSPTKCVLITHFYNEELLLPYWINHHASMFDEAILIDYDSTDRSREYIQKYAPSTWKVVKSRNRFFGAEEVDAEVEDIERMFPDETWKLVLTVTEFLIWPNMRAELESTPLNCRSIPMLDMAGDDKLPLKPDLPLIQQRALFTSTDLRPRFVHRHLNDVRPHYAVGRHSVSSDSAAVHHGIIFKYTYSPWPEIIPRKLQIAARQPPSDIYKGFGGHHQFDLQTQHEQKAMADSKSQHDILRKCPINDPGARHKSRVLHEHLQLSWSSTA